jgi:hypothetical protein
LYFSVKLDGSGNKDGSFIYWTFCVWISLWIFCILTIHISIPDLLFVLAYTPPKNLTQFLLEWGLDTFSNCGFHTFESMRSKDLGKKILGQLNTDNGMRRGSHLVACVKRVARNSTMYRAQFTASVEAICKSEFQPTVFIIGQKYVSHSSQTS